MKLASGDYLDMKVFELAMRHLLDTYLRAEDNAVISAFDGLSLVGLIVEQRLDALIQERRAQALEYQEYLKKLVELDGKVKKTCSGDCLSRRPGHPDQTDLL